MLYVRPPRGHCTVPGEAAGPWAQCCEKVSNERELNWTCKGLGLLSLERRRLRVDARPCTFVRVMHQVTGINSFLHVVDRR